MTDKNKLQGALIISLIFLIISILIYCIVDTKNSEMPNRISFHKIKGGRVLFTHKIHNEDYSIECISCHHNLEEDEVYNCSDCHMKQDDDSGLLKRSDAFHSACINCHKKEGVEATECSNCHIKH